MFDLITFDNLLAIKVVYGFLELEYRQLEEALFYFLQKQSGDLKSNYLNRFLTN